MIDQNSPTSGGGGEPAPKHAKKLGYGRGAVVGPYEILDTLGEGGFGTVYLADQKEPVRRRVALKVVKPGMDSAEVIARFEAERQALALMDHPGVAKVLDAGVTDDGRPYFVMEYVQGVPINEYCDQNRLAMAERLDLFMQVCRAVQHAHQKGIIHRDIKPSNLMVTRVDGRPAPKVIDFGIAKAMGQRLTDGTVYTEVGRLIGTLEYMSPEQAAGGIDVDTRTDTYALGVVLYQLLTGALPFESETLRKAGYDGVQKLICEVDPPKPSTKLSTVGERETVEDVAKRRGTDATGLRRQIQGDLDWIVMKALDKDRARRYDSPSALADDIERHLKNEPVSAGPPSAGYRIGKFLRRHRAGAAAGAMVLVMLVAGLAVSLTLWGRAEEQRIRAEKEEQNARAAYTRADDQRRVAEAAAEEARKATALATEQKGVAEQEMGKVKAAYEFVSEMFATIDPALSKGRDVTVREVLDGAAARAQLSLRTQPEVEAAVRRAIGGAYYHIDKFASAETNIRRAVELLEKELGAEHPETLSAMHDLGAAVFQQDRKDEAMKLVQRAVDGRARALGPRHRETMVSRSLLAMIAQVSGDYATAETLIRGVVEDQTAELGAGHRETIESRSGLADLLQDMGKFDEAVAVSSALVKDSAAFLGEDDTLTMQARSIHAAILVSLSRDAEAEAEIKSVLEAKRRVYGADHTSTMTSENVLADTYKNLGRLPESEVVYRSIVERATRVLGEDHNTTLTYVNNLAQALRLQKKYEEAEPLYRRVVGSRGRDLGVNAVETLIVRVNLGIMLQEKGDPGAALPVLQEALTGMAHTMGEQQWMTSATRVYVAECLAALKRFDEAEPLMVRGCEELVGSLGPAHGRTKKAAAAAAAMYTAWGKPEQAAAWQAKSK